MNVKTLSEEHLNALTSIVGEAHVSIKSADLDQHARDQSFHEPRRPAAVVWPVSTEQVSAVLKLANQQLIPVTPWGAGTSLEGNPIPVCGGIVLNLSRMNQILEVRVADFQVDVQPGVLYKDMNARLARSGLFFAPDPGANASIGGMIANNAAGTRTPKYGATRENVLRLELVTASGEIIQTGCHSVKSASGYDLVHLFIGSEGTLGVVTQATLKLAPVPEKFSAVIASFETIAGAAQAVSSVMGCGVMPVAMEFLDVTTVRAFNSAGGIQFPEQPTLLMEFHSAAEAGLQAELELVRELCDAEGCMAFQSGLGREERDRLWSVRHQAYEILVRNNPGHAFLIVDVAVPISRFPELVAAVEQALARRNLSAPIVGHAGDGNLHTLIPYTPGDATSQMLAHVADAEMVEAAIALNGTATGEHGVGIGKRQFMAREHGSSLALMRAIKNALDPNGILNPGKIFEETVFSDR
jgi:D-lactate dehydrogenase (cytochrome)